MSIYVSIASYEDRLLINTICDALSKANNEEDIVFGLALQYDVLPDLSFLNENQKRVIVFNPETRPGIIPIRKELKDMCREDYFLQIDAHTDFHSNWDTNLIKQLNEAKKIEGSNKVLLSRSLNQYYGKLLNKHDRSLYRFKISFDLNSDGFWQLESNLPLNEESEIVDELVKTYGVGAGFIFADSNFVNSIDYDQYSSAAYEEIYLSYKIFMLGWSIYSPHTMSYLAHDLKKSEIQFKNSKLKHRYIVAPNGQKVKSFAGINKDSSITYKEINDALIYNNFSKYSIKNAIKTPDEFWKAIGLFDFYLENK